MPVILKAPANFLFRDARPKLSEVTPSELVRLAQAGRALAVRGRGEFGRGSKPFWGPILVGR